jgi:hypothetical protein
LGSNRNFVCGPWVKGRCKSETAYLRCNSRKGGAAASGLSLALSMAWHCAQCARARLNPRRASGCARAGPLNRSMTGAMIREILDVTCRHHHQGVDDSRRQGFPEARAWRGVHAPSTSSRRSCRYVAAETFLSLSQVPDRFTTMFQSPEQARAATNDLKRARAEGEVAAGLATAISAYALAHLGGCCHPLPRHLPAPATAVQVSPIATNSSVPRRFDRRWSAAPTQFSGLHCERSSR